MAKKNKKRVAVPEEIKRQVLVEAGFKCSVPRCPNDVSLEVHHIDYDRDNHDPANLLVLCSNCHGRATRKEIDRKACLMIKDLLRMQKSSKAELEEVKDEIIAELRRVVVPQEVAKPLLDKDRGTQRPNGRVQVAASQVMTFDAASIPLPTEILRSLAYSLYTSGELHAALEIHRTVMKSGTPTAIDYLNLGALLAGTGRKEEAEKAYRTAIDAVPTLPQAWSGLGNILREMGRYQEVEDACRKALDIDEKLAGAWLNLGTVFDETGRKEEAEEAYRTALQLDPHYALAWCNLGSLLMKTGRNEEAEDASRKAMESGARNADQHNSLAYLLWECGRYDEAELEVREALKDDPNHVYAHATLGLLRFEQNDLAAGRDGYEKAIEVAPDDLPLQQKYHYEYGRALVRNGKVEEARKELEAALKVDANHVPREQIEAELAKLG
jgi:tetratricopeptide (TPR) repeat protein